MKEFFAQNIWVGFLFVIFVIAIVVYSYVLKIKRSDSSASPNKVILIFVSMFVVFPLISYFVLVPMFAVNPEAELQIKLEASSPTGKSISENTGFISRIMESLNSFFEKLKAKPAIAGLVIAGIGLIMLIALIMDADWMLEGENGSWNIASISKIFGRKTARIIMSIPCILLVLAGILMAWVYS